MTEDNNARLELYGKTRNDLLKRQLSNSENADRAVLTVSTAALGFSLAFLKDIVPLATASQPWLLYLSWLCFVLAIIITFASFFTSQKAIDDQLTLAERYYLHHDDDAYAEKSTYVTITDRLNLSGSVVFVVGIVMTCAFAAINLGRETSMSDRKIAIDGATIPNLQRTPSGSLQKGAPIPNMQPVAPQSGAPIPTMQKTPTPVTPPAATGGKADGK